LRRGRHGIADETNLVEEHEHVLQVDLAVIVEIGGEAAFIIIQKTFLAEVIRQQEKVLVVDDVVAVRSLNRALQGSSWPARELAVSREALSRQYGALSGRGPKRGRRRILRRPP
jgi:hypothetical protein